MLMHLAKRHAHVFKAKLPNTRLAPNDLRQGAREATLTQSQAGLQSAPFPLDLSLELKASSFISERLAIRRES